MEQSLTNMHKVFTPRRQAFTSINGIGSFWTKPIISKAGLFRLLKPYTNWQVLIDGVWLEHPSRIRLPISFLYFILSSIRHGRSLLAGIGSLSNPYKKKTNQYSMCWGQFSRKYFSEEQKLPKVQMVSLSSNCHQGSPKYSFWPWARRRENFMIQSMQQVEAILMHWSKKVFSRLSICKFWRYWCG